ncbi:hypothetical protein [Lysobacter sp. CA199]|uniref:hypothetical protein n=1 Tax=Lysobacter sp. CA199 TaxID=3455608 RepID=UPI003F8D4B83
MKRNARKAMEAVALREVFLSSFTVGQSLTLRVCLPPPTAFQLTWILSDEAVFWYEDGVIGAVVHLDGPDAYDDFVRHLSERRPWPSDFVAVDALGQKRYVAVITPERPTLYLHPDANGNLSLVGIWFFGFDHKRRLSAPTNLQLLAESIAAVPLDVPLN